MSVSEAIAGMVDVQSGKNFYTPTTTSISVNHRRFVTPLSRY